MFGFGFGFWNQFQNSQIDELLSDTNYKKVDIDLILDDEGVIQELRNQNTKLTKYFTPRNVSTLIDYITSMPPENSDRKRAYKFPFVACELLCIDNSCILDSFFNLDEVIQELEKERLAEKAFKESQKNQEETVEQEEEEAEEKQEDGEEEEEQENQMEEENKEEEEEDEKLDEQEEQNEKLEEEEDEDKKEIQEEKQEEEIKQEEIKQEEEEKEEEEKVVEQEQEFEQKDEEIKQEEEKYEEKQEDKQEFKYEEVKQIEEEEDKPEDKKSEQQEIKQDYQQEQTEEIKQEEEIQEEKKEEEQKQEEEEKVVEQEQEQLEEQKEQNEKDNEVEEDYQEEDNKENIEEYIEEKCYGYSQDMCSTFMLNKLFGFLQSGHVQEYTLAGYFSKVILSLLSKRTVPVMKYIFENSHILKLLITNLEQRSYSEIVVKLLTPDQQDIESYLDERRNMIIDIMQLLQVDQNTEVAFYFIQSVKQLQTSASLILQEILQKYSQYNQGHEIFNFIINYNMSNLLFSFLANWDVLSQCVNFNNYLENIGTIIQLVLQEILQKKGEKQDNQDDQKQEEEELKYDEFLTVLVKNLESLISILNYNFVILFLKNYYLFQSEQQIKNQLNETKNPFGLGKLKILEILGLALKLKINEIGKELMNKNFFQKIMEIFIQYEWNTFMHQQVEKIFSYVFSSSTPFELKAYVIKEADIVNFFINATQSIANITPPHNPVRKGNLGQLTNIANALKECTSIEVELQNLVEDQAEWFEFEENFLCIANENNNQDIGGLNQKKLDSDLFENKIEFDKELIPQKYEAFLKQRKEETNENADEEKLDSYAQLLASINSRKFTQQQEQKETLSEAIQSYLDQGTAKEKEEDKEIESEEKENIEEPKVIEWKIPQPVKDEKEENHKEEEFGDFVTSNVEQLHKEDQNQQIQEEIQENNQQKAEIIQSTDEQYFKNNYWTPNYGYLNKIDELMGEI